jgi:hypothetical protein
MLPGVDAFTASDTFEATERRVEIPAARFPETP